jgi:hypothetical protein
LVYQKICSSKARFYTQNFRRQLDRKTIKFIEVRYGDHAVKETRNTEFTERAVNDPNATEQVELGEYRDVGEVSTTAINSEIFQDPYKVFNMEAFEIDGALKREYKLGSYNWSEAMAAGTNLATLSFPENLFDQPFIADKIKNFRYFRGGVRLSIRIVANKFLYGKVIVAWHPQPEILPVNYTNSIYQLSSLPHVHVSAAAGETETLDIPFVNPNRTVTTVPYQAAMMGSVWISVLNPLNDINGTVDTAKVLVMAQFLEPQLYFPFTPSSYSYDLGPESKVLKEKKNPQMQESKKKSETGTISGALETVDSVASVLESVPFVSPYASLARGIAKPAAAVAKMFGLSKPTTLQNGQVSKIDPNWHINYGKGIDCAVKASMDPENGVTTLPNVGGLTEDDMDIHTLAGLPTLIRVVTLTSASTNVCMSTVRSGEYCYGDYLTNLFNWYSGSYKFKVYITASLFHSVRLVFWFNYGDNTNPGGNWENCYHQVVDVQGDTEYEVTLPYTWDYLMITPQSNTSTFGFLFNVSVLSWSQPDDTITCPVYLNIYKACDADFQWGQLKENMLIVQSAPYDLGPESNPRADFSKPFPPMHPSFTGYSHDKLLCGEQYKSVREIVHRTMSYKVIDSNKRTYNNAGFTMNAKTCMVGLEMIGTLFYSFWKGSIRLRLIPNAAESENHAFFFNDGNISTPGVTISSSVNPVMEMSCPYYYNYLYQNAKYNTTQTSLQYSNSYSSSNLFVQKSADDDFSFFFPTLCPSTYVRQDIPVSQTTYQLGQGALNAFLA